ncbi:MAG: Asp-tRNA(Asn)/Glu-tRNA(Gln) amidotransferase subunit GatC [Planctomycetota bacterium]
MVQPIDLETVKQVAKLAKLELDDARMDEASSQLGRILEYVNQLESVECPDGIDPFYGVVESKDAIREDAVAPSLPRNEVFKNSPDSDGEYYRVPKVLDRES